MPIDFILNKITDLATKEQLVDICRELANKYKQLEDELKKLRDWEEIKKDYDEVEIGEFNVVVYQHKKTKRSYCPNCFINEMKAIPLQPNGLAKECTSCNSTYNMQKRGLGSI